MWEQPPSAVLRAKLDTLFVQHRDPPVTTYFSTFTPFQNATHPGTVEF
jgi:hypothetical protein